ncbi:hypothetical protein [Ancylobacter sp.]|uniref:hypothetical protein n=1 Tax=Ancylobacter sp. TaxID=1872567 RepID=UPI003BAC68C2
MNTTRIVQAANEIEKNERALKWLEEYGHQLSARDRDSFTVELRLHSASACPGGKEAETVLSSLARFGIDELVETAKRNCRNTIEISRNAIAQEVAALNAEPGHDR